MASTKMNIEDLVEEAFRRAKPGDHRRLARLVSRFCSSPGLHQEQLELPFQNDNRQACTRQLYLFPPER